MPSVSPINTTEPVGGGDFCCWRGVEFMVLERGLVAGERERLFLVRGGMEGERFRRGPTSDDVLLLVGGFSPRFFSYCLEFCRDRCIFDDKLPRKKFFVKIFVSFCGEIIVKSI